MTACVNRKHTKKVAAVVTASLVGALSLGVAPVAAMAEDTGIDLQFATPEGAFSNGEVRGAWFEQLGGNMVTAGTDGVYHVKYSEDHPVVLSAFNVHFFGTYETDIFKIDLTSGDYEVAYFNRGDDGYPTGDEITGDVSAAGKYVAVVTAVSGDYAPGKIYIPFDIDAIQLNNIVVSDTAVTYNAEVHTFDFAIDTNRNGVYDNADEKLYPGDDYDVEYVKTGHDSTNVQDVKNVGTYTAKITGKGRYAGTVELSQLIEVKQLDLTASKIIGLTSSADTIEPKNLFAILIDGVWYSGDDAIMGDIQAHLQNDDLVWMDNGSYGYKVTPANDEGNVVGENYFTAQKVSYDLSFQYGGSALADSYDVFANDSSTHWSTSKITGTAANGKVGGFKIDGNDVLNFGGETVYKADGTVTTVADMNANPGTYTIVYKYISPDGTIGGFDMTTVHVYREAVNADAKAAVLYDADGTAGPGRAVVVSSISKVYDGVDLLSDGYIRVAVEDAAGNNVIGACSVKYYNAEGKEVGKIVNAGTYTLKVTSSQYKISGTTEMTITVGKLDLSNVKVTALENAKFDDVHAGIWYLPWEKDGVTLDELGLAYLPADAKDDPANYVPFPMDKVKATVFDAAGNEVDKIEDEGVYTIKFSARNDNAANNYVVPADVTVTCIKDGSAGTVDHLVFTDVSYTDYFADPVYYVNAKKFMNGYADTNIFGSYDAITRGQVACVLYNMAMDNRKVDEDSLHYVEGEGYVTGFSDVDGEMYYAKAIAWAKQAGVINGYAGTTEFRPDAPVTREEFCAMLANYASKYDESYAEGDVDSLAKFDDADGVSKWAEGVVAWGVENGIIGNGGFLNAQGDIIRADAACMVYNYAIAE